MKYVSTRGQAPVLGFSDVILAGLARDGGLYVPQTWPQFDADTLRDMAGLPYAEVAKRVLEPFLGGEIDHETFSDIVDQAYESFEHAAVAPLVQTGPNEFVLELFHGPTLAFKDVAMQLLARLMDHILAERGEKVTIVGATSGDTGGAAIEAFHGREHCDVFILYPHGKVSDVQRLQMTGVDDPNVHALAIEGNFDDCQALVKAMFNHHAFRDGVALSGVNSINWGRIMAQIVYYFTAAAALGGPDRAVSFSVPTGNFGDIFAGYAAKRMGLNIDQLLIATNSNDILARTLESGRYETSGVHATTSPSMDIQVSSNFERLLFEAGDRDSEKVGRFMSSLSQSGAFTLDDKLLETIRRDFSAGRANDPQVDLIIENVLADSNYLLDPHTATGISVAREKPAATGSPMVVLATAHPAKFPDAVKAASGIHPELPARCEGLMEGPEHFTILANEQEAVEAFIKGHSRAAA
ncbi:threonine synthase [Ahrensia sp. R2A130]|uniref:threonine synthase n=1 Tax=Ahrensia sp. R2A130 TaxID=744979 RepID=UPI0001E0D871|nr:threonine synthase [Ahrensia sp. R2A130]EFL88897.1 threonine synthase [Ahrensia sp. R2A130]